MNQTDQVYNHLINQGWITDREADRMYGIRRLAARIHELRESHVINTDIKTVPTRSGKARIAEYWLECDCPTCNQERESCRH